MKPPTTKTYLLPHIGYGTTKEPSVALRIRVDNIAKEYKPNRLPEDESLVEHMLVAMVLINLGIIHFDAELDCRIIHPTDVDGARGGERPR